MMSSAGTTDPSLAAWDRLSRAAGILAPGVFLDEQWRPRFRYLHRESREAVLRPHDPKRVVFVVRGLVRFYTLSESGEEHNQFFGLAGDFVHAFLAEQQGIPYGAEALERSDILVIDTSDWEDLGPTSAGALILAVKDRMLEHKARHSQILQNRDTRRRVEDLRSWKPEWWVRAPQYHLANYLGVSEVTLSRVLAKDRS
jgi:CRP-like cAMP-binding protein